MGVIASRKLQGVQSILVVRLLPNRIHFKIQTNTDVLCGGIDSAFNPVGNTSSSGISHSDRLWRKNFTRSDSPSSPGLTI